MTRNDWKAFHHAIRADARAFRESHGGYPCFTRHLQHNGEEWSFTRRTEDGRRWESRLRKTLIRQRAWRGLSARALNECRDYHRDYRSAWKGKRMALIAIRSAVEEARATRENSGWARPFVMIDRSSRYAA